MFTSNKVIHLRKSIINFGFKIQNVSRALSSQETFYIVSNTSLANDEKKQIFFIIIREDFENKVKVHNFRSSCRVIFLFN